MSIRYEWDRGRALEMLRAFGSGLYRYVVEGETEEVFRLHPDGTVEDLTY